MRSSCGATSGGQVVHPAPCGGSPAACTCLAWPFQAEQRVGAASRAQHLLHRVSCCPPPLLNLPLTYRNNACSKALEHAALPDVSPESRKKLLSFVVVRLPSLLCCLPSLAC